MQLALVFLCSSGALVASYIAFSYWQARYRPTSAGEDAVDAGGWRCRLHTWERSEEAGFVCLRCGYVAGSDLISDHRSID